jgi:hypothetical protein
MRYWMACRLVQFGATDELNYFQSRNMRLAVSPETKAASLDYDTLSLWWFREIVSRFQDDLNRFIQQSLLCALLQSFYNCDVCNYISFFGWPLNSFASFVWAKRSSPHNRTIRNSKDDVSQQKCGISTGKYWRYVVIISDSMINKRS